MTASEEGRPIEDVQGAYRIAVRWDIRSGAKKNEGTALMVHRALWVI